MDSLGFCASSSEEKEIEAFPRSLPQAECNYRNPKKRYEKLGSAGIKGSLYQIDLLTMVLLNGILKVKNWRLSTEDKAAAQLDDLIFEYLPSESAILLQAKHKEDEEKEVTYKDLMSVNKNSEFGLPKYFFSYQEVKAKFKVQNIVICTNLKLDQNTKSLLKEEIVNHDSVLHFEGAENICYGFSGCSLPELERNIKMYQAKNTKNKDVTISSKDINDFLYHTKFFPNCLGQKTVENIIQQTISRVKFSENLDSKMIQTYVQKKMTDWFKEKKGRYLTEADAKAFFCDMRSNKYCEELKLYDISFKNNNLPLILQTQQENDEKKRQLIDSDAPVKGPKRISHIIPDKEYILNVVKTFKALPLHHKEKTLFVNPDETVEVQKEIIDAFEVPHYTILVMADPSMIEETIAGEICDRLTQILDTYKYKHVILIADERNYLATQLKHANIDNYEAINDSVTDLDETTQGKFKRKKLINFQGCTMSLEELCTPSTENDLYQIVNSELLSKLARSRKSEVGRELQHLDNYYLSRSFNLNDQNISEEDLWRSTEISEEKVVLISDSAGMGKSSVLTSLGISIKKNNPNLWVVRFDLSNYTHIMKATLEEGKTSVSIIEMLNSQKTSRLKSEFDKKLFAMPKRVVLMLDGVDEVSPTYTELVINLIRDSLLQVNVAKIFVTARPHMSKSFEKISELQSFAFEPSSNNYQEKVKFFTLEPFSKLNQIDFLVKYWTETLDLQGDVRESRCKIFAEALIENLSVWLNEERRNNFAGIPLQTRMLAEIFQEENQISYDEYEWEGCKEFSSSNNEEPKLPTKINITQLYKLFIDKKCDIYIKKSNPGRHSAADEALKLQFEECQKFHQALALKTIFGSDEILQHFTCYTNVEWPIPATFANNFLFGVGIVQSQEGNIEFLHRTFAEYFAVDCLLIELDCKPINEAFQQFFMDTIMMYGEFYVMRAFLDSRMQNVWQLMENNFRTYFRRKIINERSLANFFKVFASEDLARTFKCFIECIDKEHREILFKTVNELNLMYEPLTSAIQFEQFNIIKLVLELNETFNKEKDEYNQFLVFLIISALDYYQLEIIEFLSRQVDKGANILGRPALYEAALMGRLEVVEFLVEEAGIDINIKFDNGETILHKATTWYEIETVKYLVEKAGADMNVKNNDGETPLHRAASWGSLPIVKYLATIAPDINIKNNDGNTALHAAACSVGAGRLEIVKYLVEDAGADINTKNNDGNTALHRAAFKGELEIVKYLVEGAGADINIKNYEGQTTLHMVVHEDELEILKYLVEEAGANINIKNNDGNTALHIATFSGQLETVKYLVEGFGVEINMKNNDGDTALHRAADDFVELEIFKYLIEAGADLNIKNNIGQTALFKAVNRDRLELVKYLVEEVGADINVKDNTGSTALHRAVYGGVRMVKYQVEEAGADIMIKDDKDATALHVTGCCGGLRIAKYLVEEAGVEINVKNNNGETALHRAISWGELEIVKYLAGEAGADVHIKDNQGWTALHKAAYLGLLDVVKFLVEEIGADINIKDNRGRTALRVAADGSAWRVVKFLSNSNRWVMFKMRTIQIFCGNFL